MPQISVSFHGSHGALRMCARLGAPVRTLREGNHGEPLIFTGVSMYDNWKSQCGITEPHFPARNCVAITRQTADENCILESFSIHTFLVDYNKRQMGNFHYPLSSYNYCKVFFPLEKQILLFN